MTIRLPYTELEHYVFSHYNKAVEFRRVSGNTISVGTTLKVAFISQSVNLNVSVNEIRGKDIVLSHDNGFGIDLIIKGLVNFVLSRHPDYGSAIETGDSNTIVLHLGRIKQLDKVFESVVLKSISFDSSEIVVGTSLI